MPRGPGAVARAGLRAQPSDPPPRATEQAQTDGRTLAVPLPRMRRSVGASVSTRRPGRSEPARSGVMALSARGADFTTTPRSRLKRSTGPATEQLGPGFNVSSRRVGVSNRPAGASGHVSRDRGDPARGPGRGVGDAASCGHRGALAWDALLGRGRGSLGAQRAGASKRQEAAHPLGKRKPAQQQEKPHAVKEKMEAAHPRGKTKPSRSEEIGEWGSGQSPR